MHRKAEAGFTLIELLVVVTVIGILAAMAVPVVTPALHKTKFARAVTELKDVANAWNEKLVTLPTPVMDWFRVGNPLSPEATFPQVVSAQELEDFLEIPVPEFDPWGNRYEYRVEDFPSSCLLARSPNADGQWSTEPYVAGTEVSPEDRVSDLVVIETRWINAPAPTRVTTFVPPIRVGPPSRPRFLPVIQP
jgi:prepilin-type N-terminal cleavage/methylation domain-containing protein